MATWSGLAPAHQRVRAGGCLALVLVLLLGGSAPVAASAREAGLRGAGAAYERAHASGAAANVFQPWQSLGGVKTSAPGAIVSTTGFVYAFARGTDRGYWYRRFNGTTWGDWQSLGGILTSPPQAIASGSQVYVFGTGADNAVWYRRFDGRTWEDWQSLGGVVTSSPQVVAASLVSLPQIRSHIYVFAKGADNAIWYRRWSGSEWEGWQSLGGILTSEPFAVARRSQFFVFARGGDNALWYRRLNGTTWDGWQTLGGSLTSAPAAATLEPSGFVFAFVKSSDDAYSVRYWDGVRWADWQSLGGTFTSAPAVDDYGLLYVVGRTPLGGYAYTTGAGPASWREWTSLGHIFKSPPAVSAGLGEVWVFGVGTDDALWWTKGR